MDLHVEIRLRKTASRKLTVLEEKVRELPHLKDLEKKRDEKRKHLFEAQDCIVARKDGLLEEIEALVRQSIREEALVVVCWNLC